MCVLFFGGDLCNLSNSDKMLINNVCRPQDVVLVFLLSGSPLKNAAFDYRLALKSFVSEA